MKRLEIAHIEGDTVLIGGATHAFFKLPGTSIAQDFVADERDVARLARLPRGSELYIARDVEVTIGEIAGNIQCGRLDAPLHIGHVAGMVGLDTIGAVTIHTVGGNAVVYHASGMIQIDRLAGNLLAVDVPQGVAVQVKGDVVLDTELASQARFTLQSTANVTLRLHNEINARFVAQTMRGKIHTRLPLLVEHGRKRNLVGVMGRGDAEVTLRCENGNITIIAATNGERSFSMGKEFASKEQEESKQEESKQEGAKTWEGRFGKNRFRAQWERSPQGARFRFQGPFLEEDDPDGQSVPFEPDFAFEWDRKHGMRAYGEYEKQWEKWRERAERSAERAGERAKRYADRAARRVRDTDWEAVERDVLAAIEKAMADLEEALSNIRSEWSKRRSEKSVGEQAAQTQRVHVEVDETATDDVPAGEEAPSTTRLSRDERDAQRRVILEELRTGTISLEEAERRLTELN